MDQGSWSHQDLLQWQEKFSWVYNFVAVNVYIPDILPDEDLQRQNLLNSLLETSETCPAWIANESWFNVTKELNDADFFKLILDMVQNKVNISSDWPQDLRDFIKGCSKFALVHHPPPSIGSMTLSNKLKMGMNAKKSQEVVKMVEVVKSINKSTNHPLIVDLGAGQGYLCTTLAHTIVNNTYPTCIGFEASDVQHEGSNKRIKALAKGETEKKGQVIFLKEMLGTTKVRGAPEGALSSSTPSSLENLNSVVSSLSPNSKEWTLVGLHACGDLTPTAMKIFTSSPNFKHLVLVGCCYNLSTEPGGFPLSEKFANSYLGPIARTVACQAVVRWGEALQVPKDFKLDPFNQPAKLPSPLDSTLEMFHRHHIRNVLQLCLWLDGVIENKACRRGELEEIRYKMPKLKSHQDLYPFSRYVRKCMTSLERDTTILKPLTLTDVQLDVIYEKMESQRRLIIWMWTLRAMMGRVLESIILLDRRAWFQEQGLEVELKPLWDPEVSPRNMAIIVTKP